MSQLFLRSLVVLLVGLFSLPLAASPVPAESQVDSALPEWIWVPGEPNPPQVALRKVFQLPAGIKQARLAATCDNSFTLHLNGAEVLSGDAWDRLEKADVTGQLRSGENTLAVAGHDDGGAAGLLLQLDVVLENDQRLSIISDTSWKGVTAAAATESDWTAATFDDSAWPSCRSFGTVGESRLPWSGQIDTTVLAAALGRPTPTIDQQARPAQNVTARGGFRVELVFDVPKNMGSWVCLTKDDRGRLIASDQAGAGLFLIEPAAITDRSASTRVTKLPVELSSAQGLLWAHGGLYVVVNGSGSGLYRASDTTGDGLVDTAELLQPLQGGGEHGPHAVILAPDGQSLLVDAGNHTKLPEALAESRVPTNWDEDHILPRRWDANGHAAGILAPGGWICQVDTSGQRWEPISIGYRNQYDIALNADGELFTYDADMEWDLGSPWYRPTRVNHATSGSEFGWRSGTGKWPSYYEDSLPEVVDIGPGSPVGITFGYGARFPEKYQRALFLLDWTYSTIYACHMTPDGASYRGEIEDFVFGQPLQVTDAVVADDGALYFTIGGRGTNSALYRVVYDGPEPTDEVDGRDPRNQALRELRHRLEAYHRAGPADMELIWGNLAHTDRFIRYAARIALEHQPAEAWRERAVAESNPRAALTALMALARQGTPEDRPGVLKRLAAIDPAQLDTLGRLTWLRNFQLALIRLGDPSEAEREMLLQLLEPHFPSGEEAFDAELIQLLVRLDSDVAPSLGVEQLEQLAAESEPVPPWGEIAKRHAGYGGTVQAMMDNMPPVRSIHYAFVLRNAERGWTESLRRRYLEFFSQAARHPGGASFPGFLKQSRDDAIATIPVGEQPIYDDILSLPLGGEPFEATPPEGPGQTWTQTTALEALGDRIRRADFDRGRNLFHAASCAKCHRFAGEGGAIGPDLSTAGRKFSLADLMEAIIEPSKAISDQYGSHQILTSDGQTLLGRVVEIGDQLHVYTADVNLPPQVIDKDDVEEMVVSPISQMPVGTIDALSPEELKHLVAYILSAGNRRAEYFR